jgi:hypothetical protein
MSPEPLGRPAVKWIAIVPRAAADQFFQASEIVVVNHLGATHRLIIPGERR